MIPTISLTSKENLKREALILANGDIQTAKEIYEFLADGMDDLPVHEPKQPTWSDNAIGTVSSMLSFAKENQDAIVQVFNIVKGLFGRGTPTTPVTPLPPID